MNTKVAEKYEVYHANTESFKNSAIIYMQNLLNFFFSKIKKKFVLRKLCTEFQSPTMPGTGQKVCGVVGGKAFFV